MKKKQTYDMLIDGVKSLLKKDGYSFSEEDRALLNAILVELEEMSNDNKESDPNQVLKIISLLLRFLKFFGVENISELF